MTTKRSLKPPGRKARTVSGKRIAAKASPTKVTALPAPAALPEAQQPPKGWTEQDCKSWNVVDGAANGAAVAQSFQRNLFGTSEETRDSEHASIAKHIRDIGEAVHSGNLWLLEEMLVAQATALQSVFTSLARRAASEERLSQYQTFMQLGLKAQAQSRATIQTIVELKYPRQLFIAKQVNNANGPQQVNNGLPAESRAHAENPGPNSPSKLLEVADGDRMEQDTAQAPSATNPGMEAMGVLHRPDEPGRQEEGKPERVQRRRARPAT